MSYGVSGGIPFSTGGVSDAFGVEGGVSSDASSGRPRRLSKGKLAAIIAGGVAAVAVIVVAVVLALGVASSSSLSDEDVLAALDVDALAADSSMQSEWANGEGFSVASSTIDSLSDVTGNAGGPRGKEARVTVALENGSLRITTVQRVVFYRVDDAWQETLAEEASRTVEPIGGVDDAKVVEHGPTLLQLADKDPFVDAEGDEVFLADLYGSNVAFEVIENATTEAGGTVTLGISAQKGMAGYAGTLTASFAWNGSDWEVASCAADDASYQADYSAFVGTWTGEFVSTDHNAIMDEGACYGGRGNPASLTVKSVDSTSLTATVDMTFLVHGHASLDNAADSTDGDAVVQLTDVLITLDPDDDDFYQIYEGSDPVPYNVELKSDEDGAVYLQVNTEARTGMRLWVAWRNDVFKMTKAA